MSKQIRNKRKYVFALLLFLLLFPCASSVKASVRVNADGTCSYIKKGKKLKNQWITEKGRKYYADRQGRLYTNGVYRIGKYYYGFDKKGRLQTSCWFTVNGRTRYFSRNGVMLKNQWVGRYYVGPRGDRVTCAWQDDCYLGSSGKAYTCLHKIGKYYYYFNAKTYKKITGVTKKIKGKTYRFDKNGKGRIVPETPENVTSTYTTDPQVDDTTLLAAIIYCEAGNQSYTGKLAVGMVIMNRVYSRQFPGSLKEVIYQKSQFAPAANGTLTRTLKKRRQLPEECIEAAEAVLNKYENYQTGQKVYLTIDEREVKFPYLYFMSFSDYSSFGLSSSKRIIGGHVFFASWR